MNDTYVEWLIERKTPGYAGIVRIGIYAFAAVFFLAGLFMMIPFLFIPGIAVAAAGYFLLPRLNVEFEYLYLQRSLSIDRIFSKEKRKKAAEYDLDKMEIFAEEGAWQFDQYKNMTLKTVDFTSGYPDRRRFVMVIREGGEGLKVLLEPDQKIVDAIKQIYPSKVFVK
ncbi:MAG: hypothetical protein IJ857_04245 [Lachnospiraceae bacterium]|nr:hypothetical protein [Lachnospiraceae bacterium]